MGLFRKKKQPAPVPVMVEVEPEKPKTYRLESNHNLTANNVKVGVPEDGLRVKDVYLWEDEKTIRGMKGNDVIFEVSSRSKAYKELLPRVRRKVNISIREREGDYGKYYRMRVDFDGTQKEYDEVIARHEAEDK